MLARIPNFFRAPTSQRRAVASALRVLPAVKRGLQQSGYAETLLWLDNRPRPPLEENESGLAASRANTAIKALPWRTTCLERSLVVWWVAGADARVKLGVAIGNGSEPHRFHAWVEQDGVVINDSPEVATEFLPLTGQAGEAVDPGIFD